MEVLLYTNTFSTAIVGTCPRKQNHPPAKTQPTSPTHPSRDRSLPRMLPNEFTKGRKAQQNPRKVRRTDVEALDSTRKEMV
jgi:hypothetical protein